MDKNVQTLDLVGFYCFKLFMIRNGIYDEFKQEAIKSRKTHINNESDFRMVIARYRNYRGVIDKMLVWKETANGYEYWKDIDRQYSNFYRKCTSYARGLIKT